MTMCCTRLLSRFVYVLFFLLEVQSTFANASDNKSIGTDTLEIEMKNMVQEISEVKKMYSIQLEPTYEKLFLTNIKLRSKIPSLEKLEALLIKDSLLESIKTQKRNELSDISKIRYIKGLEIIKILYNKTLALDHHFSSVSTFNEINKISNPNNYESFAKVQDLVKGKLDKRNGFDLTKILGDNIYTSITHSLITLFTSSGASKEEKQTNISEIECILDFTLRMHNDLNTIYFETVFLQKSNESIMAQLDQLFSDYTKPIQYTTSLKECRNTDDWDLVREYLGKYLDDLDRVTSDANSKQLGIKMQIDLEFSIDRLLQFIQLYNSFVDQGEKFYEKFGIMLNSYENEKICASQIPKEYELLKSGIAVAIEKFKTAYKPVEINGSKLKQILYGISEYD